MPSLHIVPDPAPEPAMGLDEALLRFEAALVENHEALRQIEATLRLLADVEAGKP